MESRRGNKKQSGATSAHRISLDLTDRSDALDRKLAEAMERIERLRSKALLAVGSMIAEQR